MEKVNKIFKFAITLTLCVSLFFNSGCSNTIPILEEQNIEPAYNEELNVKDKYDGEDDEDKNASPSCFYSVRNFLACSSIFLLTIIIIALLIGGGVRPGPDTKPYKSVYMIDGLKRVKIKYFNKYFYVGNIKDDWYRGYPELFYETDLQNFDVAKDLQKEFIKAYNNRYKTNYNSVKIDHVSVEKEDDIEIYDISGYLFKIEE